MAGSDIAAACAETNESSNLMVSRRKSRPLFLTGVLLTAAYLGAITAYWWGGVDDLLGLTPNELGDFLAGTFAPLAFLWLVLGFLQQGDELRHSADALWLQGQELQNSVEQQRELVKATREQLVFESEMLKQQREEIERNAQPILRLTPGGNMGSGDGRRLYEFHLTNYGKPCTDIKVDISPSGRRLSANSIATGGRFEFRLEAPVTGEEEFDVSIQYLDERLLSGAKHFIVKRSGSKFKVTERV